LISREILISVELPTRAAAGAAHLADVELGEDIARLSKDVAGGEGVSALSKLAALKRQMLGFTAEKVCETERDRESEQAALRKRERE
jgi:hypothetical protein